MVFQSRATGETMTREKAHGEKREIFARSLENSSKLVWKGANSKKGLFGSPPQCVGWGKRPASIANETAGPPRGRYRSHPYRVANSPGFSQTCIKTKKANTSTCVRGSNKRAGNRYGWSLRPIVQFRGEGGIVDLPEPGKKKRGAGLWSTQRYG